MRGGLWLGFRDGGVGYFRDGQVLESYGAPRGRDRARSAGSTSIGNGILWASTASGLSRIKDGHILTLTRQNGLPCNMVHWMMEDDADSVWLYMACGLVRIDRSEIDAWASRSKANAPGEKMFDSSDGVKISDSRGYNAVVARPRMAKSGSCRTAASASSTPAPRLQHAPTAGAHRARHRRRQNLQRPRGRGLPLLPPRTR